MALRKIHIFSGLFAATLLSASCVGTEEEDLSPSLSEDLPFDMTIGTRQPTDPDFLEENEKYFQPGKSTILLSQRSGSLGMDFHEGSINCFKYVYDPPADPSSIDWDHGFNYSSTKPINWERIKAIGQFGNGYSFGALYYPNGSTSIEEVTADQSDFTVFTDNDILGAHHFTSSESDRLAFQFHHLMCMLHVDLYIPVYKEESNDGFEPDAVRAYGIQFRTDYTINFADYGQEYPPLLFSDHDVDGNVSDIRMYQYPEIEEVHLSADELQNFNIFMEDDVRKYSFEMLFPQQEAAVGDILRFILVSGDSEYNYTFRLNYAPDQGENFNFESGHITNLELYLPRNANEVVLFRGYKHDWSEAKAEFTITEEQHD